MVFENHRRPRLGLSGNHEGHGRFRHAAWSSDGRAGSHPVITLSVVIPLLQPLDLRPEVVVPVYVRPCQNLTHYMVIEGPDQHGVQS